MVVISAKWQPLLFFWHTVRSLTSIWKLWRHVNLLTIIVHVAEAEKKSCGLVLGILLMRFLFCNLDR